jgi:hypothetical protein
MQALASQAVFRLKSLGCKLLFQSCYARCPSA